MKVPVIPVQLDEYCYRIIERQARAVGTTIARHASDLLIDLLEPPSARAMNQTKRRLSFAAMLLQPSVQKKTTPEPSKRRATRKTTEPRKQLRGLALLTPEQRSEVARKAAATRKLRAEEAARKAKRTKTR